MTTPQTLYSKLWQSHVVAERDDGSTLIYVDRHLAHEVSTPQSFIALMERGRRLRQPASHIAMPDHAVPTQTAQRSALTGAARAQVQRLYDNAEALGMPLIRLGDPRQGIVHVVGPELGFTLPGLTIACGDSHTSTHGAFGALAFGIGASECATVMATQCLIQRRSRTMVVKIEGAMQPWVTPKDLALAIIARIGSAGASGHALEYRGAAIAALSMEGRMTLCNMSIEAGARVGLIAPDDTTIAYCLNRPMAPEGEEADAAIAWWRSLPSDPGAGYDRSVTIAADAIAPQVSWGTNPDQTVPITGRAPDPRSAPNAAASARMARALAYMGLAAGQELTGIAIDTVFIGSCTNGRIEDLREAARVLAGRKVARNVTALVVPGSVAVQRQAEAEGLDRVFRASGAQWREPGCSMCVAINGDRLAPGQRCAATSNRNFEGRQGQNGRTHLMSPAMAAAAAVTGHLCDVRELGARS